MKHTATLTEYTNNTPRVRWVLRPTDAVWREPWWGFRHRHLAMQFAERRGIRLETNP